MRGVIFPSTVGAVCAKYREGLAVLPHPEASGVTVQPKNPTGLRRVSVRDDSGPDDGPVARRRYGVNVWAESSVVAENLAILLMAISRNMADGAPIVAVDTLSGPFEIDDDTPITQGTTQLAHYYFTFRLTTRGANF